MSPCAAALNSMELFKIAVPWAGSILAELVLIWVMFHRRMIGRFPCFFGAIVFDAARAITLLTVDVALHCSTAYFYIYWISIPLEYSFSFAVIYEIFQQAFQPELRQSPKALRRFLKFNAVLVVLSAALTFQHRFPLQSFPVWMMVMDRSAELMRCGMLLFLWAFAAKLKITWRHHLWGIALGLGLYSACGLITAAADVATGRVCSHWLTPVPHFAYFVATVIWPIYLWRPEPVREPLTFEQLNIYRELLVFVRETLFQIGRALHNDH
jgi:hypothetical protein